MKNLMTVFLAAGLLMDGSSCSRRMTPERVAQMYAASLQTGNREQFCKLLAPDRRDSVTDYMFQSLKVTNLRILKIQAPYIDLTYTVTTGDGQFQETGTIYLLPDFTIKYEPVFLPHIALAIRSFLEEMRSLDPAQRLHADQTLKAWGVSDFGFDPNGSMAARKQTADEFEKWLNANGATFDLGDVHIPVSPTDKLRF